MSANLLASQTSPYLFQHKDNPVHWRPWGPDALAEAKQLNKPILVSVGYAACHWCHVMAHESFEDAETAEVMNDLYVCIKVDREERPDIDGWLQKTLSVLGRPGGWPLTVFLNRQRRTVLGRHVFSERRKFRAHLASRPCCANSSQAYHENPDQMEPNIRQIAQRLDEAWYQNRAGTFDMSKLERIAVATAQNCDIFYGGVTGAPKFPNVPIIELMWRAYLRTGMQQFLSLVLCTLDYMGRGGIYDQIGGGFARYAIDEEWQIPHFEKMLYDNAQMLDLMTLVWQHGRQPVLKQRIEETVGWVLRDMLVENAGFASSVDADSEGREGKFYVWTESEIDSVLQGTNVDRFKQAYGVTRDGNFPHEGNPTGLNILHRVAHLADWSEAEEPSFTEQRRMLLAAREKRVKPGRDDKVLIDWNGLTIASLANAGSVFSQSQWVDAARRAFHFVCEKLGEGDRLFHSYRAGQAAVSGLCRRLRQHGARSA